MKRTITYAQAIREATEQAMDADENVFLIGEGAPDPKHIFGTTAVKQKERVFDMPVSENGMTGVCIGAAINGLRPILTHQRVDFSLLSLDQIINNAAKWHYMFGGTMHVPLVIRMIVGRGWGQGAQHSQNIQALFAHIPGLKVVMPATPKDAKGLLLASVKDNNPVIFIEHRWLHNIIDYVPEEAYETLLGKANILREGTDVTIVSTSFMTLEAVKAALHLEKAGISAEIVDLRTIKPLDEETILRSVKKTGRLLVADTGYYSGGLANDIIARVTEKLFTQLKEAPRRVTLPDIPTPTSRELTKHYYPSHKDITREALELMHSEEEIDFGPDPEHLDIPDKSFTGPF